MLVLYRSLIKAMIVNIKPKYTIGFQYKWNEDSSRSLRVRALAISEVFESIII